MMDMSMAAAKATAKTKQETIAKTKFFAMFFVFGRENKENIDAEEMLSMYVYIGRKVYQFEKDLICGRGRERERWDWYKGRNLR